MSQDPPAPRMGNLAAVYYWWRLYSTAEVTSATEAQFVASLRRARRCRKMLYRAVRKAGFRHGRENPSC